MAQNGYRGTVSPGGERPRLSRSVAGRPGPYSEGPIHFMPNDGRRFPMCGSWRSNWNHTADADGATCLCCRARLAADASPSNRI
jgi:hypothetical protein